MLRAVLSAAILAASSPALATVELNVGINLSGDVQIQTTIYGCGDTIEPITVKYVNAAPNFFAIVPIGGKDIVFVNVLTASGAKYVSGQLEWWSKGVDATLHDITEGLDAAPVLTCSENVQTP